MTNYRRHYQQGGTYFFTVNLHNRKQSLLTEYIDALRTSFTEVKQKHPFAINAIIVLPDHLHTIWTLPSTDKDYSTRWRLIKTSFSKQLPKEEAINKSRQHKKERGIWQRRFWEHYIRNEKEYTALCEYIHHNPVKHGYVNDAHEWPYSSIHRKLKNP